MRTLCKQALLVRQLSPVWPKRAVPPWYTTDVRIDSPDKPHLGCPLVPVNLRMSHCRGASMVPACSYRAVDVRYRDTYRRGTPGYPPGAHIYPDMVYLVRYGQAPRTAKTVRPVQYPG